MASQLSEILVAYLITFGWAITGSIGMGLGIVIALKIVDLSTPNIDEWKSVSDGNVAMAIVLAAIVLAVGVVISAAIG